MTFQYLWPIVKILHFEELQMKESFWCKVPIKLIFQKGLTTRGINQDFKNLRFSVNVSQYLTLLTHQISLMNKREEESLQILEEFIQILLKCNHLWYDKMKVFFKSQPWKFSQNCRLIIAFHVQSSQKSWSNFVLECYHSLKSQSYQSTHH